MTTDARNDLGLKDASGSCSCCTVDASAAAATPSKSSSSTEIFVEGMTCAHCVGSVTGQLASIAGVDSVAVDLQPGGASRVTISSDRALAPADLEGAVAEAGYTLVASS